MIATSQVQRHFQKHNIYKRSRRYYDIEKIKGQQHSQQLIRRKPQSSLQTLQTRVDSSFVNLAKPQRRKILKQLQNAKRNFKEQQQSKVTQSTNPEIQMSADNKNQRIRVPALSKMLSREQTYAFKPAYSSEDHFNNFAFSTPKNKNLSFEKACPRKNINDSRPQSNLQMEIDTNQIGKCSQKNKYDESINKCLFEYRSENKRNKMLQKQLTEERQEDPVIIELERMKNSQKNAQKNPSPSLFPFYLSVSRGTASQMDMKLKKNTVFLKKKDEQDKLEYSTRKRKEVMIEKRASELLKKKRLPDSRAQMCDDKYFRRNWLDININ